MHTLSFACTLLSAALLSAYPTGWDTCPPGFQPQYHYPGHGTFPDGPAPFALQLTLDGNVVTSWTQGQPYILQLVDVSGQTLPFGGLIIKPFTDDPVLFSEGSAGSLQVIDGNNFRDMGSCDGGITHSNSNMKTLPVSFAWTAPRDFTGVNTTFWAVVVQCMFCGDPLNYQVRLVLPMNAASPSPLPLPSPSPPPPSPLASPSATPSGAPSMIAYPSSTQVSSQVTIKWNIRPGWVDFLVQVLANAWVGFARSDGLIMINSDVTNGPGSGPAVIGKLGENSVGQYRLDAKEVSGIVPVTDPSIQSAFVWYDATNMTTNLMFSRPLNATGDPTEKSIEPANATDFIYAFGSSPTFGIHQAYGLATLVLQPPPCVASLTCNGHGTCADSIIISNPCYCDVGYTGLFCQQCAAGFEVSSGGSCIPEASERDTLASLTLRLLLPFSQAGTPGSAERAAFVQALQQQIASPLSLDPARVNVSSLASGSIVAGISILPPVSQADVLTQTAAETLGAMYGNTSSPLYEGSLASAIDPSFPLQVSFSFGATYAFTVQLSPLLSLSWSVVGQSISMLFQYTGDANSWFAVGFNQDMAMPGSDVIAYEPGRTDTVVNQYTLDGQSASAVHQVPAASSNIQGVSVNVAGAGVSVAVTRSLAAGAYSGSVSIPAAGDVTVVFAHGQSPQSTIVRHASGDAGGGTLNTGTGAFTPAESLQDKLRIAHGALMAAAWGVLIPLGIIIGRFTKNVKPTSGPNAFWFVAHRAIQMTGVFLAAVGFSLAVYVTMPGPHFDGPHQIIGLIVTIAGIFQPMNAFFRPKKPGPGEPENPVRKLWEFVHKGTGYGAVVLASCAIILGLLLLQAPSGYLIAYIALACLFVLVSLWLEISRHFASRRQIIDADNEYDMLLLKKELRG